MSGVAMIRLFSFIVASQWMVAEHEIVECLFPWLYVLVRGTNKKV